MEAIENPASYKLMWMDTWYWEGTGCKWQNIINNKGGERLKERLNYQRGIS